MKISDLEAQAAEIQKSLDGKSPEATKEPVTQLGIVQKALDLLGSMISSPRLKKAMPMGPIGDPADGCDDDEEEDEVMDKKMFAKKSGETKQPYGDQNSLNTGDMDSPKKIKKKFNYDAKMEDDDVDVPSNAEVPYYDEKRNVRKSIDEISNDPDLSEDEKVFVINQQLDKGFNEIHEVRLAQAKLEKSVEVIAYGLSVMLNGMKKSLEGASNAGRGRISMLSAVDKPAATNKSVNGAGANNDGGGMTRLEFSERLLKAQKSQKISFQDVALAETCVNEGMAVPSNIMSAIRDVG